MVSTPYWAGLGILVIASVSFFFALAETALFTLGKWQLRQLTERRPKAGGRVARLLAKPDDLLATIVLGNTFTNAAIVAAAIWVGVHGHGPVWLALALALALILVGCELAPKTLAVRSPERWAARVAAPMRAIQRLTGPWQRVAQRMTDGILRATTPKSAKPKAGFSDEDYQELLELAYQQGALAQTEKEIILQIVTLDQRTAREVMRPRSQVASISDDLSVEEMIAAARKYKHRRLPIFDESPDTIVGVLNTRALLMDPQAELAEAIEFPSFVPESMNLLLLLKSLQKQQRGLAIVLDEYGAAAGIVTMEYILEVIVGEIRGEGEPEGFVMERLGEGRWRVNGTVRLDDFRREYPALGEVEEVDTMGGLLMSLLGVVPTTGQSATFCGLRLTARAADERRVRELLVETAYAEEPTETRS